MTGYQFRLWRFVADMNWDGAVTVSDVWLWFKWLYFYPGDGLLYIVEKGLPAVAQFFEISIRSYGSGFSGVVSFFFWLAACGNIAASLWTAPRVPTA